MRSLARKKQVWGKSRRRLSGTRSRLQLSGLASARSGGEDREQMALRAFQSDCILRRKRSRNPGRLVDQICVDGPSQAALSSEGECLLLATREWTCFSATVTSVCRVSDCLIRSSSFLQGQGHTDSSLSLPLVSSLCQGIFASSIAGQLRLLHASSVCASKVR